MNYLLSHLVASLQAFFAQSFNKPPDTTIQAFDFTREFVLQKMKMSIRIKSKRLQAITLKIYNNGGKSPFEND